MPIILAAQTSAANSLTFYNNKRTTRTVSCFNLAGAETAVVQINHDGTNWISMGAAYTMTPAAPVVVVQSEGNFRVAKSVTAGASSVAISS